jgi:hypothetical protein
MQLVLVLDHLGIANRSDTSALHRELLHLYRHGTTSLRLDHSDIILGL